MAKTTPLIPEGQLAKEKRERFVKVAGQRVQKAIKAIALIGNCSAKASYGFEQEDVDLINGALVEEVANVHDRFNASLTTTGTTPSEAFSFEKKATDELGAET